MKQLSSATFHDFNKQPTFIGQFTGGLMKREADDPNDKQKKKGDLMGFDFTDEDGSPVIVGASSTIENIMLDKKNPVAKDAVLSFTFEGKGVTKTNKPFNRFKVILFDSWEEASKHHAPKVAKEGL
jgi:hypothetical protein